jgi:DNA polymerase-3 subunit gamma/tau
VTALYRKYRPQDFDEVVGQEAVVRTLRNAIERDQVRQAYLFAGPRGTGKTSMARIVAKALNCVNGPTASPCGECNSCRTIAAGTSLDVVEMDAASQRGIDDIREIRDHVILQPVEGRYKVYILDEAHQLTDAAFNALLKLIEEPPPHLVFIFCTTDLSKMLPTVRSRCQTFRFERPRLGELTRVLRVVADGEDIETTDAALSLVARSARGSFRDAVSTLDQLASSTAGDVSVPAVLELLGAIDDDALFRLLDLVVDRDTAGLLTFVEELADQGHDMGRLVTDLLEHLRHVMLVQHMGEVPDSIPVTDDARERLRTQASQLGAIEVLRLVDLLAVAVEDMRQGGDPRLPLELALVKVTQPEHDPTREALAQRIERLEARGGRGPATPSAATAPASPAATAPASPSAEAAGAGGSPEVDQELGQVDVEPDAPPPAETAADTPSLDLDQLRQAWDTAVVVEVEKRSIPAASVLREARPASLEAGRLVIEFPPSASFHRNLAEEPKNAQLLAEVLRELTGARLALDFAIGQAPTAVADDDEPKQEGEAEFVSLFKDTFDARELHQEE